MATKLAIVRDSIEIELAGEQYEFERPVIAMRRRFKKDYLRIAAIFKRMEFAEGVDWSSGKEPLPTPENALLTLELVEEILDFMVRRIPPIADDQDRIFGALESEELDDGDVSAQFRIIQEFVNSPFPNKKEGRSRGDTSANGSKRTRKAQT